jgi:hypothetical protein
VTLPTVAVSPEALQQLPTPARPRLDPADVLLPAGYRAEVVLAGLSMPCGMGVDDEGTVYVLEGGSTWPTRPHLPGRILRLRPDGTLDALGEESLGGPRHVALHDGGSGAAWHDLRQLTLSNLDSMSAFAVAEQLGLALGRPRAVDVAFRVVSEKSAHQLLLREVFLEFAADAVLHRRDV